MKKICFAASSGGHLEQLMMLKSLMKEYESFIITEKTQYDANIKEIKTYKLSQINRKEFLFIPKMISNFFRSFKIFIVEHPDVVITTGVLAVIPMCLICKLFNKKLIYIESYAKVNTANSTGKLLYKFADKFYVQWSTMLEVYPDAEYIGSIY